MMEEERERMMREKEMLSYADWETKEDQFHLSQAPRCNPHQGIDTNCSIMVDQRQQSPPHICAG